MITSLGTSCSGDIGIASLTVSGTPSGGGQLAISAWWFGDFNAALVLVGLPAAPTPLPNGCSVDVAPLILALPLPLSGAPPEAWLIEADVPTSLTGLVLRTQLMVGSLSDRTLSNAVDIAFG